MNWTLWLLLAAMLALAALMSVTRASLAGAARMKPAAAKRLRNERIRGLDELLAKPASLDWALNFIENAAKVAAVFVATLLIIIHQDARNLALAIVLVLCLLALAPLAVERLANRISYRFCLIALPVLKTMGRFATPLHRALQRFLAAAPAAESNGTEGEKENSQISAPSAPLHQSIEEAEKKNQAMLGGLLNLKELAVSDVMIHRTKMMMVDAAQPPTEIIAAVLNSRHTRLPIYRERPDNILGILNARDLFSALQDAGGDAAKIDVEKIAKPAWFVPDTRPISDQLNAFLRRKTHFALVVDEYGEVMGLITLEDILEEIVGDIVDEHDALASGVRRHSDGSFTIDGTVPIRDLNRALEWDLPDDEATTLAGLVVHEARMIPSPGQAFTFHGFRFEVLRKRRHQVTSLKVTPEKRPASTA